MTVDSEAAHVCVAQIPKPLPAAEASIHVPLDFLSDAEVLQLTKPKVQAAAQKKFLDRIGVPYVARPDGRPVISRAALSERLSLYGGRNPTTPRTPASHAPDRTALKAVLDKRKMKGAKHGKAS